ncbi:hypothetical protein BN3660_00802 [Eubacteriaceae bacterium CHKCI004]|nr:hypothetical protein BN3660_00802 [Eubacteriaceae bacterium CHKCI004]
MKLLLKLVAGASIIGLIAYCVKTLIKEDKQEIYY